MASPFRLFRKHVKPLLAVFVVLLMLSWVVGDSLMGYLGGPSGGGGGRDGALTPNAVAVTWDGGQLTNREVAELVMRRQLVNTFVRSVAAAGEQLALEAGVEPRPLRVEPVIGPETPRQGVERSVVDTKIVADLARKAGMKISDDAIVRYLDELGRGRVSREDMRGIIKRMQVGGGGATIAYVLDALRDELLARNFITSYQFSLATVTPEERWKDWLQSNDRIVLEAAPFPAEKFLVDVPEPTDAELAAFVEPTEERKYSLLEREPQPDARFGMELPSPTPGFATPRKIDVQYIEANYDKFLAKVENEITDVEITKFYDEHKDPLFIKLDTGRIDEAKKAEEPSGTDGEQKDAAGAGKTDEKTPPATDTPQPPAEAGRGDAGQPDGKSSSSNRGVTKSPFRLAAFQQEPGATAPAATGTPPPPTSDATSTAPAAGAAPATPPAAGAATTAEPPAPEKPKEFQPLDEVRDEIRRQLASERVAKQLIDLMEKIDGEVNAEFTKYFSASLNARADEKGPPPPTGTLADLKSLAEKNGLEFGTTGPLSYLELRKTPVGESIDPEARAQLSQILFGSKDLEMFQPILTVDLLGNRYLSMKTGDTPRRVPTLAEVRDQVVQAWKLRKAAEAALKHAEELTKKIGDSGTSLSDYFADDKSVEVVRTDPFSRLTGGEVSRITGQQHPLRLSEPDGVVAAGPEFMANVFELEDGKPGATLNHDKSIAYVVRVADHQLSPEALRTAYLAEANTWPALGSMIGVHMQDATRRLLDDIVSSADIDWVRPPDQVTEEE